MCYHYRNMKAGGFCEPLARPQAFAIGSQNLPAEIYSMDKIKKISINDKNYPKLLKKIGGAPKILYYRGALTPNEPCFAIVGARRYSDYGKQITLEISRNLSETGIIIVSGMAPGIDTFAHTGAVLARKRTIAVLGTGLDEESIYPKENIELSRKIIQTGGCLISEYPAGTRATKFTFPHRNRIVSGLSLGILVVEAKEKSGTLITATCAFSQRRKIFAVPGSIYSLNSKGPNDLIKRGARLVDSYKDIVQELGLSAKTKAKKSQQSNATIEEKIILGALANEPLYIDKIIEKTKLDAKTIASCVIEMEIEGKVKNLGNNIYAINNS